jgi:NMD protein affecting ribosome stability and mRNA decay
MTSPCPNCGKQSKCGCKSCIERNGFDAETETFDETGELIICPFCKVASHPDHWLDTEVAEMKTVALGLFVNTFKYAS